MKLGTFVKTYRKEHGNISQRELAEKCGLSNAIISMIEKGMNPSTSQPITPTLPTLRKLSAGMNITLDDLFNAVDEMNVSLDKNPYTDEEKAEFIEFFDRFRKLSSEQKTEFLEFFNDFRKLSDYDRANVRFYMSQFIK